MLACVNRAVYPGEGEPRYKENKMQTLKIKIKKRLPNNPFFIITEDYDVKMQNGKKVKASDLLPGDHVILPLPFFPGTNMDLDCTIISIEKGPIVKQSNRIGCFYIK